jgi:hypothetical protein
MDGWPRQPPIYQESRRAGDADVQVELAAALGGGEGDQVAPGFVGY